MKRIERRRAADEVHESLRRAILDRTFEPGSRLNVEKLAGQLGVSLTPIRSAIHLLAAEGLVDVHSRSGTFVATLTKRDLEEIFDLRCALETLAAEHAEFTDAQLGRADELLKILAKPVRNESSRAAHESANSELHTMIIEAAGNRRLNEMYRGLESHIAMQRLHGNDTGWKTRLPEEQEDHERIVEAMKQSDAKALAKALREHILRAKKALGSGIAENAGENK